MNILLIAGGWSTERDVSLSGGRSIEKALVERGHRVQWLDPLTDFDRLVDTAKEQDFAFINLHGPPGEDGLVQAMLDRCGCPYQGSSPAASFLALNKAASKQLFRQAGLQTPDWEFLPAPPGDDWHPAIPYPLFVKSNTGGSSLRLGRANDRDAANRLLQEIFSAGEQAMLEPAVPGQEVTCGVLGDVALPPILIEPLAGDFFDYLSKYRSGGAKETCPAPLPADVLERAQTMALAAHEALGLEGYSRSDFILRPEGDLTLLEVNTLPGMTATSLIPQEAAAIGIPFGELLERLMELATRQRASSVRT
jgi:D-alanine-D-alanine ligase